MSRAGANTPELLHRVIRQTKGRMYPLEARMGDNPENPAFYSIAEMAQDLLDDQSFLEASRERVKELEKTERAILAKCYPIIKDLKEKTDDVEVFLRVLVDLSNKALTKGEK